MCNLSILCYGSLTTDNWNSHFCRNGTSIEPATVCGRIYQLSPGYPALLVPAENIIAKGTASPTHDARTQYDRNLDPVEFHTPGGWYEVHGELVTFENPERDIPKIDALEGHPVFYERVLLPVRKANNEVTTAWVYIMYRVPCDSILLKSGHWPE